MLAPLTLAIETSTPVGSVGLALGDQLLAEIVLGAETRHSEQVLPAIDYLFRWVGRSRSQLERVVIGAGPGSFTGLRIAAATAKGLVTALQLELFAYSGLLAVAAGSAAQTPVCALFDARRDEVYAACYRVNNGIETIMEPRAERIGQVLAEVSSIGCVFAGEGALKHQQLIISQGGSVLPMHLGMPRASALIWLAHVDARRGRVADAAHWEPDYLRAAGAERGIRG
jgi:tRNA threonylcarbamoyladenosine biosynthesis protein TsaB